MRQIVEPDRQRIAKSLCRFFERHAMLAKILFSLLRIPRESSCHATEATSVLLLATTRAEGAQSLERPDAVGVTVHPIRLDRVVADRFDVAQIERRGNVALRA